MLPCAVMAKGGGRGGERGSHCRAWSRRVRRHTPLRGAGEARHLPKLRDGLSHSLPGIHGGQLERDNEGKRLMASGIARCCSRVLQPAGLFGSALGKVSNGPDPCCPAVWLHHGCRLLNTPNVPFLYPKRAPWKDRKKIKGHISQVA